MTINLDDNGNVADTFVKVVELRGVEKFCIGRPVEELPRIVTSICGVCPWHHHLTSAKANDAVFGVTPPPTGTKLRDLCQSIAFCSDKILHFFFLAGLPVVVRSFSWTLLVLLLVFALDAFVVLPLISTKHGCKECPQRDLCPWMKLRGKSAGAPD